GTAEPSSTVTVYDNGTPKEVLQTCDPIRDCDRIFQAVSSAFRIESRVLELLSINRISQSSAVSLFFRSTREAETNGVQRFHDTWGLIANFFEWGEDSKRGRETAERMRQIHGRYYIPNAGMKYVLLQTAFTFLDGADRLGHRPLLDVERRGYFHAYVKLGLASNIAELSHDYDEMYGWYRDFNRANSNYQPIKTETFEALVGNSMGGFILPGMKEMMFTASRVGMDDAYLAALNYPPPTASERGAVRSVFFTLGQTLSRLPYTPFIRSLQNNPAKNRYTGPGELGVSERSKHLPSLDAAEPNGGFPEQQRPILSDADIRPLALPVLSWEEVARHNSAESLWVVIDGEVHDLTVFASLHPGGLAALLTVAGKDASQAFATAPHTAATRVFKLNYRIGRVAEEAKDGRQRS
ncbi:MAG: cytochrome b5-like heme/steroid binding domain-containing protein, partial [Deltaproteobacteria bacterium]